MILLLLCNFNLLSKRIKISELVLGPFGTHELLQLSDVVLVRLVSNCNTVLSLELVLKIVGVNVVLLVYLRDYCLGLLCLLLDILTFDLQVALSLGIKLLASVTTSVLS